MPSLYLTPEQLHERTGRSRADAQVRALIKLGIPFNLNIDNKPLVRRELIDKLDGVVSKNNQITQPNFDAVRELV